MRPFVVFLDLKRVLFLEKKEQHLVFGNLTISREEAVTEAVTEAVKSRGSEITKSPKPNAVIDVTLISF